MSNVGSFEKISNIENRWTIDEYLLEFFCYHANVHVLGVILRHIENSAEFMILIFNFASLSYSLLSS